MGSGHVVQQVAAAVAAAGGSGGARGAVGGVGGGGWSGGPASGGKAGGAGKRGRMASAFCEAEVGALVAFVGASTERAIDKVSAQAGSRSLKASLHPAMQYELLVELLCGCCS